MIGVPSRVEALCIQMYASEMQYVARSPDCTILRTAAFGNALTRLHHKVPPFKVYFRGVGHTESQ